MNKKIKLVLSLLIAIIILGIIIYKAPELWEAIKNVDLYWMNAGFGCFAISYLLRAVRLKIISKGSLSLWPQSIHSVCSHGFIAYMLPLRTGDLSLPVILKSISNMTLAEGGAILLKARLLDVSILGFWMLCAAFFSNISISIYFRASWIALSICMLITPVLLKRFGSIQFFKNFIFLRFVSNFSSVNYKEIFNSLGIWAALGACFYCTARAVGLSIGMWDVWLLISIQLPLQLIPVQGFANTGNHEGGWIAGLALLGIPPSIGMEFALTSHALLFCYILMLVPIAFISHNLCGYYK